MTMGQTPPAFDPNYHEDSHEESKLFVGVKACRVYVKKEGYAILKFGPGFKDTAVALPSVIYINGRTYPVETLMEKIPFANDQYYFDGVNCPEGISGIKWLAQCVWYPLNKKPSEVRFNLMEYKEMESLINRQIDTSAVKRVVAVSNEPTTQDSSVEKKPEIQYTKSDRVAKWVQENSSNGHAASRYPPQVINYHDSSRPPHHRPLIPNPVTPCPQVSYNSAPHNPMQYVRYTPQPALYVNEYGTCIMPQLDPGRGCPLVFNAYDKYSGRIPYPNAHQYNSSSDDGNWRQKGGVRIEPPPFDDRKSCGDQNPYAQNGLIKRFEPGLNNPKIPSPNGLLEPIKSRPVSSASYTSGTCVSSEDPAITAVGASSPVSDDPDSMVSKSKLSPDAPEFISFSAAGSFGVGSGASDDDTTIEFEDGLPSDPEGQGDSGVAGVGSNSGTVPPVINRIIQVEPIYAKLRREMDSRIEKYSDDNQSTVSNSHDIISGIESDLKHMKAQIKADEKRADDERKHLKDGYEKRIIDMEKNHSMEFKKIQLETENDLLVLKSQLDDLMAKYQGLLRREEERRENVAHVEVQTFLTGPIGPTIYFDNS